MKRILAMALSVLLIAGMAIGGSVAYLTSTDSDENTFTMGNVKIEQIEQERKDVGTDTSAPTSLVTFENGYNLLPAHEFRNGDTPDEDDVRINDVEYKLWPTEYGVKDKIVTVKNTGANPAYVRTIFAFENTSNADAYIVKNWTNDDCLTPVEDGEVEINGEQYKLYVYTYAEALEAGDTTNTSLKQVAMKAEADNELVKAIRETGDKQYNIHVATQAVQSQNMNDLDAKGALNAAFGAITSANNPWTRGETNVEDAADAGNVIRISSKDELNALTDTLDGKTRATVVLTKDIDFGEGELKTINVPIMNLVFDGNGHTISNAKIVNYAKNANSMKSIGLFGMVNQDAKLTVKNLTLKGITVNGTDSFAFGAAAVVGYQSVGNDAANSVVTLNNVDVYDSNITNNYGNASVFAGLAAGKFNMTGCDAYNCTIAGETADKTGTFVGTVTAGGNVTINNCVNNAKYKNAQAPDFGRIVTENGRIPGQFNGTSIKPALTISTAAELKAFADKVNNGGYIGVGCYAGQTVVLLADIDLNNELWTPIGQQGHAFYGNFNGNGHTIKNLKVESTVDATTGEFVGSGLFGWSDVASSSNMTIENLTIDGAVVNGGHNCGVLFGYLSNSSAAQGNTVTIKNCTVKNAAVNCECYATTNGNHCGDKAGAIAGYLGDVTVQNCKAENVSITAGRDVGKLFGASTNLDIITGCTATNVDVALDTNCTNSTKHNCENLSELVGRYTGA